VSHRAPLSCASLPDHSPDDRPDRSPEQRLEVWLVDLSACGGALAALEAVVPRLSQAERGWSTEGQNGIRRTTRIALRLLLERLLPDGDKALYRQMALIREPAGRPSLPAPFAPRTFSLSHSGAHALIAISTRGPLGIDFEAPRTLKMPPHRRATLVAAAATLNPLPLGGVALGGPASSVAATDRETLIAWTRLEAVGKARGAGVAAVLADHGVIAKCEPTTGIADPAPADEGATEPLAVHDLALPGGLVGAIATPTGVPCPSVRALPNDPARLAALTGTPYGSLDYRPLDPS